MLHEGSQGSANHRWLASLIFDRQFGGHGTLHGRMGLRCRQAQLGSEGCIGGRGAWIQGKA